MQGLHAALSGSEAFVKFVGQPRTGKSGVCEKLTQFMRLKDYRVIYFDYPIESPDMLRSMLAKELDIPDTFNILRHLEDALAAEAEKPLVLIFDDAHLLSDITLIEIYRLAGVQVEQKRVINIVLCGEPELERRLSSKQEFTTLLQHVSHNFLLEPMNAATTSHFLIAYLSKGGLPGLQLEPAALNQFTKSCKGFPGPAYSLCELVFASRQNSIEQSPLTKKELLLATRSADGEQPVSSGLFREENRWMLFGPIAAVVVIASLALLVRQLSPPELRSEVEGVASLVISGEEESSTSLAATSPFAVDELPVADSNSPASTGGLSQVDEPKEESYVGEEELLVSDSTLALVTAQERGVSNETITEPLFEQMPSNGDPVQLANVILTRPMLALDDDEIEIVERIVAEIPIATSVLPSQEELTETAPETAPLEPVSIESLSSEPAATGSAPLSPQQVVQGWLDAWEGQDLEKYFASYDDDFVPRYHRSKSAWLSNRERVIGNASQISLEMSDFVLISEDAESMEVHFWISYSSPSYRDDTHKKLVLKKLPASHQGVARLLIVEEINLEVRV
jgi:MSHA biogenesis protein MshM